MDPILSYRDLRVWKVGMDIAERVYRLTKSFPRDELFGITSQLRRAAVSIPANIAEGYGRDSQGGYIQYLKVAQGSLKELETHLMLSARVDLAAENAVTPLLELCDHEGKMLATLITKVRASTVREDITEGYDAAPTDIQPYE